MNTKKGNNDTKIKKTAANPAADNQKSNSTLLEAVVGLNKDLLYGGATPLVVAKDDPLDATLEAVAQHLSQVPGLSVPDVTATEFLQHALKVTKEFASAAMDSVIHHSKVRDLMGAWLGIGDLVNRESSQDAIIHLIPTTKKQLVQDFRKDKSDITQSVLYRHVVKNAYGALGGIPYSLCVADFQFSATNEDVELLNHFKAVALTSHMPVLINFGSELFA